MYSPINHPLLRRHEPELHAGMWLKSNAKLDEATLAQKLGGTGEVSLHQKHGGTAVRVRETSHRLLQADAVFTDVPGLLLTVRWADCQNFLLYAPKQRVLGVVHVGWKGLLAHMLPNAFALLATEWNIEPKDTVVYAGPSLCLRCADFTNPSAELPSLDAKYFDGRHVDLQRAATDSLLQLGVREDCLFRHADCTRCHPETYWTYRGGDREAVQDGRTNALAAMLR